MRRTCSSSERGSNHAGGVLDLPDPRDSLLLIEARDFLAVHLPSLTDKQRTAVMAWACGSTASQIARDLGISRQSAHERLSEGLKRLREMAGEA